VEALGLDPETAETLGIGYAGRGMMKEYVAVPVRPSGELTGYIGVTEAKLPKTFHLSNVVTFPRRVRKKKPRQFAGLFFYLPVPEPGRVVLLLVPSVEVPGVAPVPCWLLTPPPTFVPVVPCIPVVAEVEPVPVAPPDVPVEPPDEAPAEPPADPPPAPPPPPPPCASANEVVSARTDASTAVLSFIDCPFLARATATNVSNARS
jgi:hypothetical protein